ncbi:major facilitator superfamily domain-containing protein [Glomus cerebriforme]|uniref:Major facilitator superfamily domain-containing protein n=1 Tax=Glomus cerebriforme TaxID=658196 RepID=A0A397S6X9_9GLOM|nr:major facilitator superfamily domain-containing protein [Glomus cerebriforme]
MFSSQRSKLKKKAQSSTTLQFAPPNWLTGIFERNSNNISLPRDPDGNWKQSFSRKFITSISTVPYLSTKLLFIFLCAGLGSTLPYLPIFYYSLNLSPSEIGGVFSVAPFISALSCPLWTGLADRFQAHRSIIVAIYILATIGVVSQMFLPSLIQDADNSLHAFIFACVFIVALWFAFFGIPVNALVDSGVLKILGDKKELYGQQRYWGSVAYGLSTLGVGLLLEKFENVNVIFYYFFCTAISFLIVVISTDFNSTSDDIEIVPTTHFKNKSFKPLIDLDDDIDIASSSVGSSNKFNNYNSSGVDFSSNIEESDAEDSSSADEDEDDGIPVPDLDILAFPPTTPNIPTTDNPTSAMKTLFTTPTVVTLLTVMFLMGIALSMSNSFLFLFLKNDLKASSTILGLTGPVSAVTELLFFFYSKELISQFGISSLILLAHIVTIIRCLTYLFLQPNLFSHVIALIVQLLNGIGFSSLWVSGVTHIANNAPPNLVSFSQGIMSALYAGVGTGFGSLFGGILFGSSGGSRLMFGFVIAISILSMILYWWGENGFTYFNIINKRRRNNRIRSPWQGINYGQTTIERPRSILSVETVPRSITKKGRYELIPTDDDDDEQYHYGVFGDSRM